MDWVDVILILLLTQHITTFFCTGLRILTLQGKLLEPFRIFIEGAFGYFWSKPLVSCAPCMASFHGTYIFIFVIAAYHYPCMYVDWLTLLLLWPLSVISAVPTIMLLYKHSKPPEP